MSDLTRTLLLTGTMFALLAATVAIAWWRAGREG